MQLQLQDIDCSFVANQRRLLHTDEWAQVLRSLLYLDHDQELHDDDHHHLMHELKLLLLVL